MAYEEAGTPELATDEASGVEAVVQIAEPDGGRGEDSVELPAFLSEPEPIALNGSLTH